MTDRTTLSSITRPGRYLGHEYNAVQKEWEAVDIRFNLIFPDLYEIGMSHQGLQILYHILNNRKNILAERCYCPDIDLEQLLRTRQEPLVSLESGRPLTDFDALGITLPYELCYTNILTILDLAGMPFLSKDRDETFPLVLGGGACALNPEPVAQFFDAILLGDGEESIIDIAEALMNNAGLPRPTLLDVLADIDGVYVPSHFEPEYDGSGKLLAIHRRGGRRDSVRRRVIADLEEIEHLKHPLVPNAKIVHDRLGVEVARGCTRGCRFCQAGITYRPVRERNVEKVMELAECGLGNSGFEEVALLSLSTGDYSCLDQALPRLMDRFAEKFVSVAMPSMRVGTLTPAVMDQVKRVRKTGFTLAPEAGSERLRRVINKGITEDALLATCTQAFALGWRTIKLYFMIGLPTETEQDIDEIVLLVKKAMQGRQGGKFHGKKQINVSVGTFVPKPHTPFQWERQLNIEESTAFIKRLQGSLPTKGCNLRYHDPRISFLEGVFSRGDRRLSRLLQHAWQQGARFDGWDEHFDLSRWLEAADACQLELASYLDRREMDEVLPWQHLHTGVDETFLRQERHKAMTEQYTPDCRYHRCQQCGLCDFDTLMPIVHNRTGKANPPSPPREKCGVDINRHETEHFKYLVQYSRTGNIVFLGHLEILQIILRALRRAKIDTNFSQGFNPSPKISFGPALPVGTESLAEFFVMDLPTPLHDLETIRILLNNTLVPGLQVIRITPHSGKLPQRILTSYTLTLARELSGDEKTRLQTFINSDRYDIDKTRKGKTTSLDIRPLIRQCAVVTADTLLLEIISASGQPGIKPIEAMTAILGLNESDALEMRIMKTAWQPLKQH
ncbi:MAG: TIGR03960 family B12-binding radical SAM protein [Desulforhopalus sp.]